MSSFFSQNLSDYYLFNDNRKARLENCWNGSSEIVEASADTSCHQCSTTPSDSLYTFRWMVQSTRHLVKDDVFFTTDSPLSSDITLINQKDPLSDNRSNWAPTPCLSPVTSPSDFLYDREPLFDGIGDFNEQATANPASLLTDTSAAISAAEKLHNNCNINKSSYKDETGFEQDLDWSALSSQFHDSNVYDLPTPTATMSDEDDQTVGDTDSEAGLKSPVYSFNVANQAAYTPCGRKRPCSPEPSQDKKRDKKSKIDAEASKDTLFEKLTHSGIDWCRYCGTTEGVNWRPGPWGKRTLCK